MLRHLCDKCGGEGWMVIRVMRKHFEDDPAGRTECEEVEIPCLICNPEPVEKELGMSLDMSGRIYRQPTG